MTMAQATRIRIRSAPFDFDFRKLNIETAQRRVGDILGTPRISNPKGVTTDRDAAAHKRCGASGIPRHGDIPRQTISEGNEWKIAVAAQKRLTTSRNLRASTRRKPSRCLPTSPRRARQALAYLQPLSYSTAPMASQRSSTAVMPPASVRTPLRMRLEK